MISKFSKKNQIVFFILFFLISITLIIITVTKKPEKLDSKSIIKTEPQKENNISGMVGEVGEKVEPKKRHPTAKEDLTKSSPLFNNIDFTGENKLLIDAEPSLEIDQIMDEQKKIDTFSEVQYFKEKKEDWKVDYGVGLEGGAIDELKSNPSLKPEMLNGKIGFSKSF